ncbi:alpha carbonic anhydrase 7 [Prunus dulcis]|uniref:Alpha carbonic anhydrase 7 n=1 Tax=Prunus dulcis TaxID=3755 RepID=A0A4Y1QZY5_PRUDU|nr:alpha carbonic anhydrase 7 [Prunus dulcis]
MVFNQKVQSKMAIGGLISNRNFDSFIGSEDEREFNYEDDSEKGPARWGEIRQEWSLCNKGSMQSSIDLLDDRVEVVSDLGDFRVAAGLTMPLFFMNSLCSLYCSHSDCALQFFNLSPAQIKKQKQFSSPYAHQIFPPNQKF